MSNYEQFKAETINQQTLASFSSAPVFRKFKDPAGLGSDWHTREWQTKAWALYDQLGEVRFAAEYFGNAISQACILPAEIDNSKVRTVRTEVEQVNEVANRILSELTGDHHGLDQVLRQIAIALFTVGEIWLVGEPAREGARIRRNADGSQRRTLQLVSALEVKSKQGVEGFYDSTHPRAERDGFVRFQGNQTRIRIYRPDPRNRRRATSNLQGVLHIGATLLMLDRLTKGTIKSRTHAGILKVPSEISFGSNPGFKSPVDGDPLTQKLTDNLAAPIEDPDSAASTVPMVLRGAAEYLDDVELLSLERDFDEFLPVLMDKYVRRMALGLDLPAEVLTGMGNANHWASWFLSAEFVRLHAKPFLNLVTGVLTKKLLHPELESAGVEDFERFCFTFDELALVVQANKSQNARDAFRDGVISAEAYRHHLGFAESDAAAEEPGPVGPAGREPVDVENPVINPIGEEE